MRLLIITADLPGLEVDAAHHLLHRNSLRRQLLLQQFVTWLDDLGGAGALEHLETGVHGNLTRLIGPQVIESRQVIKVLNLTLRRIDAVYGCAELFGREVAKHLRAALTPQY